MPRLFYQTDATALNCTALGVLQAYLETDPAARVTKDEYVMRYQQFARDGLEHALQKYDALHSSIGLLASLKCHVLAHESPHLSPMPCMSCAEPCHCEEFGRCCLAHLYVCNTGVDGGADQLIQTGFDTIIAHAGEAEMKQLKKTEVQFALTVADSLLAKDKLTHALK